MLTPDFHIEDLDDTIVIKVKFIGVSASKCDLVVTDSYAKFNISPYFLILNFPFRVSFSNVIASAKGQEIKVHIKKEVSGKWPPPPWEFSDKDELKKRQEESLERLIAFEKEKNEQIQKEKEQAIKESMQKAWDIEKEQRQSIKDAMESEKQYAKDLLTKDDADDLKNKPLFDSTPVASVRSKQVLKVTHTPTIKDIPARYSGPQRNFIVPKVGDASPLWMKQRGDSFFNDGSYSSAVNAYSEAIDGSDRQFVGAFSNRAAARIKLGHYDLALADCNEALSLISDPIINIEIAMMKIRLLSRKTYSLYKLKRYMEAFQSSAEILNYMKDDENIKNDMLQLAALAGEEFKGDRKQEIESINEQAKLKTSE